MSNPELSSDNRTEMNVFDRFVTGAVLSAVSRFPRDTEPLETVDGFEGQIGSMGHNLSGQVFDVEPEAGLDSTTDAHPLNRAQRRHGPSASVPHWVHPKRFTGIS